MGGGDDSQKNGGKKQTKPLEKVNWGKKQKIPTKNGNKGEILPSWDQLKALLRKGQPEGGGLVFENNFKGCKKPAS